MWEVLIISSMCVWGKEIHVSAPGDSEFPFPLHFCSIQSLHGLGDAHHCWDLLLLSCSVVSDSLQPHGLQHARLLCPSPFPRACSSSCPLSWLMPSNHLILWGCIFFIQLTDSSANLWETLAGTHPEITSYQLSRHPLTQPRWHKVNHPWWAVMERIWAGSDIVLC